MPVDPMKLTDPRQVRVLRDNAERLGRGDIAARCVERLLELSACEAGAASPAELDCWKAIAAAEDIATRTNGRTTRLSRTRQKIARVGVLQTMADLAGSDTLHQGFELLRSDNRLQFSFEHVVLTYPDLFSPAVRQTARRKLIEAGIPADRLPPTGP